MSKIVLTNGCFDLLHPGHVHFLQQARKLGDELWVLINDNAGVTELKGKGRPIVTEEDRWEMVMALRCVDYVSLFNTKRIDKQIRDIKPTIYAKGGDYNISKLHIDEYNALQEVGAKIVFIPTYKDYSTTRLCPK